MQHTGVCGRGFRNNSIQCTGCQKWVHRKCSGIKGSISKVLKSFICRGCLNPVTSTGHTTVDIGANAILEFLDKFDYLGDMLSVDGDADAAVEGGGGIHNLGFIHIYSHASILHVILPLIKPFN